MIYRNVFFGNEYVQLDYTLFSYTGKCLIICLIVNIQGTAFLEI